MSAQLDYIPTDHELEIAKSAVRCEYFVETYVKIEDRDAEGVAILFRLWDRQRDVLQSFLSQRLIQVLKARQLGLTWLALAYAVWRMLFKVGYSVVALSKRDDDAKELVRRVTFILRHLPDWFAVKWEATKETVVIHHDDKAEDSVFQSFSAGPDSGRSFTANLVLIDEWAFQQWAREIWAAAFPSVNRPTGGQVIGLSTIERGTLFEDLWTAENQFVKIFLPWDSDPRRTPEWYEDSKRVLGDTMLSEYPATPQEAFAIPGGAYFPEFRSHIHLKPALAKIPEWYRRYVMLDYGLDMLACYWVYVDSQGYGRIYRELYEPNLIISKAAQKIRELTSTEKITDHLAPRDLFNRRQETGKSAADIFSENGIDLTSTSVDPEQGGRMVKEWLAPVEILDEQTGDKVQTAALTIDETAAPNLMRSLLNIQKDKHNPERWADQPHELTHAIAALQCFCTEHIVPAIAPPDPTTDFAMTEDLSGPKFKETDWSVRF